MPFSRRFPLAPIAAFAALIAAPGAAQEAEQSADIVVPPAALTNDGGPDVPTSLAAAIRPYLEFRTASFIEWNPADRSMLVATRFGDTRQLHSVREPGATRRQITFESEPINGGSYAPDGSMLLTSADIGGNEVAQLYAVQDGRLNLLSNGTSRHSLGPWSNGGELIAYGSNARTGRFNDVYVMDPRNPESARLLHETETGGWFTIEFTPDDRHLLAVNYISVTNMELHLIDVATAEIREIGGGGDPVAYGDLAFAADGALWATSDNGADFKRLGTIDLETGAFTPRIDGDGWDVVRFAIDDAGTTIAYIVNEAGRSQLYLYDIASGSTRQVEGLPIGIVGQLEFAPWGELGFSFSSNQAAGDAYSLNPETMELRRWTYSETGGLDPNANIQPELVEIESFDGEPMSGWLYRPDPERFPGPRPLIISIHGGPEGQSTAGFRGSLNYLINERGIARFYPNVRGSTGFGKRFVTLDNGPFQREDSVRDIGAFLDVLTADPTIDADRIGVIGGSYGGYMCYASAIFYGDRLRAANCIVAISSFVTFLENTEDYRRDLRRVEYGDERDPEQRAMLTQISPMTRINEIDIPLLVVTGANDPRVPASEADQVIEAVRSNGGEAWHLLAANEGHGFRRKENSDYSFLLRLMFWEQNLLGNEPD